MTWRLFSALSHYLNQCSHIVDWTPSNKLHSEFLIENRIFFMVKLHFIMSSAKCRPFCVGFNVQQGLLTCNTNVGDTKIPLPMMIPMIKDTPLDRPSVLLSFTEPPVDPTDTCLSREDSMAVVSLLQQPNFILALQNDTNLPKITTNVFCHRFKNMVHCRLTGLPKKKQEHRSLSKKYWLKPNPPLIICCSISMFTWP